MCTNKNEKARFASWTEHQEKWIIKQIMEVNQFKKRPDQEQKWATWEVVTQSR